MKTQVTKPEPAFQPTTIAITFESQLELDVFGSLFNASRVASAIRSVTGYDSNDIVVALYEAARKAGGDIHKYILKIEAKLR